jgi:hypothetical protein
MKQDRSQAVMRILSWGKRILLTTKKTEVKKLD